MAPDERNRWRDEWLAEMEAEPFTVRLKLWFSLNIAAAAAVMAWEGRSRRSLSRHAHGTTPELSSGHERSVHSATRPGREGFSRSFWC